MGWINTFLASGTFRVAPPTDACDETMINGAPHGTRRAIQSDEDSSVASPDVPIAEEIKRRQIALAVRYVTMTRAR